MDTPEFAFFDDLIEDDLEKQIIKLILRGEKEETIIEQLLDIQKNNEK